jgi:hypothetical protein
MPGVGRVFDKSGHHVFSAGLQSVRATKTLRSRGGLPVKTDGPFAETKECLGGFTIIKARDLDEAIHLASKLPAVRLGSMEVRSVLEADANVSDSARPQDRRLAVPEPA